MFGMLTRVRVSGTSMHPTYNDGDVLLVSSWLGVGRGDVVVLEHPQREGLFIVKRITDARSDAGRRQLWLEGDNPDMTKTDDSWRFGWVDVNRIRGRVLRKLPSQQ
ncbi:MAG: S26 family signal peptidase [Actinomycetes bacterium]|jgi:phage repressor protein C with HTH and peptisase S24 domain